jgi:hypothetical protein
MKNRRIAFIFAVIALAMPALAQTAQLPTPSPIEKELAARASNVDEIKLDKSTLAFATNFTDNQKNNNPLYRAHEDATRNLIRSLDGIYVRDYEFDKEGQFTAEQIEQLRAYYESSEWTSIVRDRNRKTGESSDVMVKMVNGKSGGLFILDVEPKEISIVMLLGPVGLDDLSKLRDMSWLGIISGTKITGKLEHKD